MLEKAITVAAKAHDGQKDKAGQPYILHPLRVMMAMDDEVHMTVAVLHDVVEDSPMTADDLRDRGFPEDVVVAVDHLSRRDGEDYLDFVRRSAQNHIARKVKRADLMDNMDTSRISDVTDRDRERMGRYQMALRILDE